MRREVADGEALLLARVAMAKRHGVFKGRVFAQGVEVNRDAKGRANLILTTIALANVAVVVPRDHSVRERATEHAPYLLRFLDKLRLILQQGRDHRFDRCDTRREREIGTHFPILLILSIRACENGENGAVNTKRGFDDVWGEFFFIFLILICE